jgi:asparagine synthase (glutamine-hydrolysing)
LSGIVGILCLSPNSAGASILASMMKSLRHRGPSGVSQWVHDTVGLGQLWRSGVSQPSSAPVLSQYAPCSAAVADARLDNRSELASELDIPADEASTLSDADLICRCYTRWGSVCPQHLKGDFSFAIWDRINRCLFCARDRFGVRPFYFYYVSESWFIFASEIKALLSANLISTRINPQRIAQYLVSDLTDKQITFYRGISRLPPAHTLSLRAGDLRIERYWSLDPVRETIARSGDRFEEEFRERFVRSVHIRSKNSGRFGAMLSGGLDSSSIVSAASWGTVPENSQALKTISLVFDDVPDSDESEYIHAVLQRVRADAYFIRGDKLDPFMGCGVDFWQQDEPFYAPNLFLHQEMYKWARSTGIVVLLDGFDGDIVVSHGLAHLSESFRERRFAALGHELRALAKKWDCSVFSLIRRHILGRVAPRALANPIRRLRAMAGMNLLTSKILSPEFAQRLRGTGAHRSVAMVPKETHHTARGTHVADLEHGIIPLALEVADRASAAYGVEPRYPFFDSDFVEYCVGLPADQKLRDGWTRSILRRAMSSVLPAEVCWRRFKSDLSLNFASCLATHGRRTIESILARNGSPIWEYADIERARTSYRRLRQRSAVLDALQIWKTVTLGVWLERVSGM